MNIKVIKISKSIVHFIETDEENFNVYTRYSSDNWTVRMGECDEPIFDQIRTSNLEILFQDFLRKKRKGKS